MGGMRTGSFKSCLPCRKLMEYLPGESILLKIIYLASVLQKAHSDTVKGSLEDTDLGILFVMK